MLWQGLNSDHTQAQELILGPTVTFKTRLLSFNRMQPRVVTGLVTGHNTLRRHLYLTRLTDSPLGRRHGAQEETLAHVLATLKTSLPGFLFLGP
jgi:hypothetical protein